MLYIQKPENLSKCIYSLLEASKKLMNRDKVKKNLDIFLYQMLEICLVLPSLFL